MSTQNYVILTAAQIDHAQTLDDDANYQIGRQPVTNTAPGVGLNINPTAAEYPLGGEVVALAGCFVAPKRIVDDPECIAYAPGLRDYLLTLPWAMLEHETIFAPAGSL